MGTMHGTVITDLSKYSSSKKQQVIDRYRNMHGASNVFVRGNILYKRN